MKLNYSESGHEITAEAIVVPSSPPYIVYPEHDNLVSGTVEIWQNSDKTGTELTEEEYDGSPSAGCFQVDYSGAIDFRKSAILFNEAQAGTAWYVWYKTLGDVVEAEDINTLYDHVADTQNPHQTTYQQVGAAPASHTHPGGDITSAVANATNADKVDGYDTATGATASTVAVRDASGDLTARVLKSTVATGTAPLTITSTTAVTNLNADMVDGQHASDLDSNALLYAIVFGG